MDAKLRLAYQGGAALIKDHDRWPVSHAGIGRLLEFHKIFYQKYWGVVL